VRASYFAALALVCDPIIPQLIEKIDPDIFNCIQSVYMQFLKFKFKFKFISFDRLPLGCLLFM